MADDETTTRTVVVGDDAPVDLSLIDTLARAQLHAKRAGATIRVRTVEPTLVALLDLVGLGGIVPVELTDPCGPPPTPGAIAPRRPGEPP